jgi:hypothetical protein
MKQIRIWKYWRFAFIVFILLTDTRFQDEYTDHWNPSAFYRSSFRATKHSQRETEQQPVLNFLTSRKTPRWETFLPSWSAWKENQFSRRYIQATDTNMANKYEHVKIQYQARVNDHGFPFIGPRFQIISDVLFVKRNYVDKVQPLLKSWQSLI